MLISCYLASRNVSNAPSSADLGSIVLSVRELAVLEYRPSGKQAPLPTVPSQEGASVTGGTCTTFAREVECRKQSDLTFRTAEAILPRRSFVKFAFFYRTPQWLVQQGLAPASICQAQPEQAAAGPSRIGRDLFAIPPPSMMAGGQSFPALPTGSTFPAVSAFPASTMRFVQSRQRKERTHSAEVAGTLVFPATPGRVPAARSRKGKERAVSVEIANTPMSPSDALSPTSSTSSWKGKNPELPPIMEDPTVFAASRPSASGPVRTVKSSRKGKESLARRQTSVPPASPGTTRDWSRERQMLLAKLADPSLTDAEKARIVDECFVSLSFPLIGMQRNINKDLV